MRLHATAMLVAALAACASASGATAAKAAHASGASSDPGAWTADLGPVKAGVQTFGSTPAAYYDLVGDAYLAALGVSWDRASAVSQERLLNRFNETSNPPSPPNVLQSRGPDGDAIYMSMNAVSGGFLGGVSFYYAYNQLVLDNVTAFEHSLVPARVEARTGLDGSGKLLGKLELPLTHGDYSYSFRKAALPFKGVAKSIAFFPPLVDGALVSYATLFDNVKVVVSDKGGPVAEAEGKIAAKAEEVKAKLAGLVPELELKKAGAGGG